MANVRPTFGAYQDDLLFDQAADCNLVTRAGKDAFHLSLLDSAGASRQGFAVNDVSPVFCRVLCAFVTDCGFITRQCLSLLFATAQLLGLLC